MHARYYNPNLGRFLSVDPAMESAVPTDPQTWNRYGYVRDNPLQYVDPTGEILVFSGSKENLQKLKKVVNESLYGYELVLSNMGVASLVPNGVHGPASPQQNALAIALKTAINRSETVEIGVVAGDHSTLVGGYSRGIIDIGDIAAAGRGEAVNSGALLAHEVIEQTAKQVFSLSDTLAGFRTAHSFGRAAQDEVSGFTAGKPMERVYSGTGFVRTQHRSDARVVTTQIYFFRGNLIKVTQK